LADDTYWAREAPDKLAGEVMSHWRGWRQYFVESGMAAKADKVRRYYYGLNDLAESNSRLREQGGAGAGRWAEGGRNPGVPPVVCGGPARIVLRVNSARAEPRVEVYQGDIPPEALKRQVAALNARMEAQSAQEASLTPLMVAGLLSPTGVKSHKLSTVEVLGQALTASEGWFRVANGRMGLEVSLTLAPGAATWVPATAWLKRENCPEPLPVRSLKLLGGAALQPGNTTRLLVEWETPLEIEGFTYSLRVNERHGGRSVKVEFRLPKPSPAVVPEKETKP
jgi:hypothetical protein